MSTPAPTPEEVGRYYDQMGEFYRIVMDDNLHAGYWYTPEDNTSLSDAQNRLTDILIDRVRIGPGQRLLDVGCGVGGPALRLAKASGCSVVGVTISQSQAAQATRLAADAGLSERAEFRCADAMALPFAADTFDAAWAIESILHMPDRPQVLKEIARVLRPGGRLVITEPFETNSLDDDGKAVLFPAFQICSIVEFAEYAGVLNAAGFTPLEISDISRKTHQTLPKTLESSMQNQVPLAAIYGDDFVVTLKQSWPLLAQIHQSALGYLLAVGRKVAQ